MKLKNMSAAGFAALFLVMFLPVFGYLILIGNNMNYNPDHKIYAIYGNKVLLALVLIGVLAFLAVIYFARKIPDNRRTITAFIVFAAIASVVFYFVNVEISKCIAFYGGWDCGMVGNSARWVYKGEGMGYSDTDYYAIFTNNVPITWLLYELYSFSMELPGYPYNPEFIWIQFQCLQHSIAIFFSAMTVLLVTKRVAFSALTFVVNAIFLGLSPWKIVPYTDAASIAFPVVVLFLYAVFLQMKSKWRYVLWLLVAFLGVLGGILKATCYVTLIAIVIIDFIWILFDREQVVLKLKKLAVSIVLLLCGFLAASWCRQGMYQALDYEYNRDLDIGWVPWLYDGLNEETTGACSSGGLSMVRKNPDMTREERDAYGWGLVKERVAEKGFGGLMDFWLRKQVMTYNDGTFSWYQEGYFNAWEYPDITDSSWKQPLRDFYWQEGENYSQFVTWSHGIWLFVLVGVIGEGVMLLLAAIRNCKTSREENEAKLQEINIRTVAILNFIGVFLFLMLFEGRARYLYNSITIFSTMAVLGYCKFVEMAADLWPGILSKFKKAKEKE